MIFKTETFFFLPEGMHAGHKIGQQKTARKDFRIGLNNTSCTQIKTTAFCARILLRGFPRFRGRGTEKVENNM